MVMSDLNIVSGELPGAFFLGSGGVPAWEAGAQIAGSMPVTVLKHGQVNKPLFSL